MVEMRRRRAAENGVRNLRSINHQLEAALKKIRDMGIAETLPIIDGVLVPF